MVLVLLGCGLRVYDRIGVALLIFDCVLISILISMVHWNDISFCTIKFERCVDTDMQKTVFSLMEMNKHIIIRDI